MDNSLKKSPTTKNQFPASIELGKQSEPDASVEVLLMH